MKKILLGLSALSLGALFMSHSAGGVSDGDVPAPPPDQPVAHHSTAKTAGVSDVVTAALNFKNTLTTTQQSTLQLTYTTTLARKWSNLPCGAGCRNGIQFGTLNTTQLQAALDVIKAALGTGTGDGYDEFLQTRLSEAYLHANGGGSGYDTTLRWIAFLNTPSATGAWMLQFGGHHYAANIAFNNGHVIGATPFFMGLEPKTFTYNNTFYAPLSDEQSALATMLASLSASELATAKLTQSFSDCYMIPGETNGGQSVFPAKAGLMCNTLTQAQKDLVLDVIYHYVHDMDTATATAVMQGYTDKIDSTYVSFVGNGTAGNASSFLAAQGNYARIDGPGVWIEFSCQGGIVIQGQIHYHTVWRDHNHDYGVDLTGASIDTVASTGVSNTVAAANGMSIYPNPAQNTITISMQQAVSNASASVVNMASGQTVLMATNISGSSYTYDISHLPAGAYLLRIVSAGSVYNGKFIKQ